MRILLITSMVSLIAACQNLPGEAETNSTGSSLDATGLDGLTPVPTGQSLQVQLLADGELETRPWGGDDVSSRSARRQQPPPAEGDPAEGASSDALAEAAPAEEASSAAGADTYTLSSGAADAEEKKGDVSLTSRDLDFRDHRNPPVHVGLVFQVAVPPGKTPKHAYLTFTSTDSRSEDTTFVIRALSQPSTGFQSGSSALLTEMATSADSVTYDPPRWQSDQSYRTGDLSRLLTTSPGSTQSIGFVIYADGRRHAYSYERDPAKAPKLTIEWQ